MTEERREDASRYRNPNGCYTTEEFTELVRSGKFDEYAESFKATASKCPPSIWCIDSSCFYCYECQLDCYERVI